ncbi:putative Flagellar protein [Burkholderiales bacterium]|nr:putative Flagellar protein [Burkholderiales bacterium]
MNPATLRTLIEVAAAKCDAAQARYASMLRLVEKARTHLAMLQQYAKEYRERARCQAGDSRDPSAERNQVVFLDRLQLAIDAQERELGVREKAAAAAAGEVALCLRKRKSLETLASRRIEREQRAEARRDQKNTDEFAQRSQDRAAAAGIGQGTATAGSET